MIILHNATIPFDGDEIVIVDPTSIESFTVDHSRVNSDCTRLDMHDGAIYFVQESVDTLQGLIEPMHTEVIP